MKHDEITKQKNEETKTGPVTSGSVSDADLEQVAGGGVNYYSFNIIGGRSTIVPIPVKPRR